MSSFPFGGSTSTSAPAFGTAVSTLGMAPTTSVSGIAAPAFGFGGAPATSLGTSYGFSQPAAVATSVGPSFGGFGGGSVTTTSAAPVFGGFAAPAAPTGSAPTFTGFGATSTSSLSSQGSGAAPILTGFGTNVPATTSAPAPTFGGFGLAPTATTSIAVPTQGLGGGSFSFGKPATSTSVPSLSFSTTTTAATVLGSGGLFGKPSTAVTAAAPPTFVGLGGIDIGATQPKKGDNKQDIKVKETQVPDEISKTVESLKAHIKSQKTLSSDIGRTSTSKLSNVSGEIMNLQWSLQEVSNSVEANYNHIKLLRKETSKVIQSVEMAQRTQETPAGLQFENTTPLQYFQNLVVKYEQDLVNFRNQITLIERHMQSLTSPQQVSPDDMKRCLQQINESFISLAGRLHEIHQQVESQKEQYLNIRKYRLRDATNMFAQLDSPEKTEDSSGITPGPSPFSTMNSMGRSFYYSATTGGNTAQQNGK